MRCLFTVAFLASFSHHTISFPFPNHHDSDTQPPTQDADHRTHKVRVTQVTRSYHIRRIISCAIIDMRLDNAVCMYTHQCHSEAKAPCDLVGHAQLRPSIWLSLASGIGEAAWRLLKDHQKILFSSFLGLCSHSFFDFLFFRLSLYSDSSSSSVLCYVGVRSLTWVYVCKNSFQAHPDFG